MTRRKNIIFMGSDAIGLPVLDYLASPRHNAFCLSGIITQPDRPVGRGKQLTPNAIQTWANNKGIRTLQPERLGDAEVEWLKEKSIDLAVVIAYGQIIKRSFLETLPLGAINMHGSLLPAYRGASPVETAIAQGDLQTGISLMQLVSKMDAGPVCNEVSIPIHADDTALRVRKRMAESAVGLFEKNITSILNEEARFYEQDPALVTYCRKLTKDDAWIDFNLQAKAIYDRYRAFNPWPGCMCEYEGIRLKVVVDSYQVNTDLDKPPGTILGLQDKGLAVAASKGVVFISSLQRPGGKMLPAQDFLRGFDLPSGNRFTGKASFDLVRDKYFARE